MFLRLGISLCFEAPSEVQNPTQLVWICLMVSVIISQFLYTPPIWPSSCPQSLFNAPQVDDDTSMPLLALKIIPLLCHTRISNKSRISSSPHPTESQLQRLPVTKSNKPAHSHHQAIMHHYRASSSGNVTPTHEIIMA